MRTKTQNLIHPVNSNLRVRSKANHETIFVEDPSGFKSAIASRLRLGLHQSELPEQIKQDRQECLFTFALHKKVAEKSRLLFPCSPSPVWGRVGVGVLAARSPSPLPLSQR